MLNDAHVPTETIASQLRGGEFDIVNMKTYFPCPSLISPLLIGTGLPKIGMSRGKQKNI